MSHGRQGTMEFPIQEGTLKLTWGSERDGTRFTLDLRGGTQFPWSDLFPTTPGNVTDEVVKHAFGTLLAKAGGNLSITTERRTVIERMIEQKFEA